MAGARAVAAAVDRLVQLAHVDRPEMLGLAEGLGEAVAPDHAGEVDQRAGDRGDRDALDGGDVLGIEGGGVVDLDAGSSGPQSACGRHVDARAAARPQPVQRGRLAVTQRGSGSDGEDGREPIALRTKLAVAEGVDAGVETHKVCGRDAGLDHRGTEADRRELPTGDHTVLALREGRQGNSGRLGSYIDHG